VQLLGRERFVARHANPLWCWTRPDARKFSPPLSCSPVGARLSSRGTCNGGVNHEYYDATSLAVGRAGRRPGGGDGGRRLVVTRPPALRERRRFDGPRVGHVPVGPRV